jgi:hypothetical protein
MANHSAKYKLSAPNFNLAADLAEEAKLLHFLNQDIFSLCESTHTRDLVYAEEGMSTIGQVRFALHGLLQVRNSGTLVVAAAVP